MPDITACVTASQLLLIPSTRLRACALVQSFKNSMRPLAHSCLIFSSDQARNGAWIVLSGPQPLGMASVTIAVLHWKMQYCTIPTVVILVGRRCVISGPRWFSSWLRVCAEK